MSIVVKEKEELTFTMSHIIFPLTDILDLRFFVKICALSMFETASVQSYINIFIGVMSLNIAVLDQTIFELGEKSQSTGELYDTVTADFTICIMTFETNGFSHLVVGGDQEFIGFLCSENVNICVFTVIENAKPMF
jgi:hypothetical protein